MVAEQVIGDETRAQRVYRALQVAMKKRPDLEPDELYVAPSESWFTTDEQELDFLPAPDLEIIAGRVVNKCSELEHLNRYSVTYLWKKEGGKSQDKAVFGKCTKASGMVKHFSEATWVIWLAADHVNFLEFTRFQVEALLYHEMLHAGEDEDSKPKAAGHDFAGFGLEVQRYGAWDEGLKICKKAWEQLSLFD